MRAALNVRFRSGDAPRILFIHRGRCFFQRWKRAHITAEYRDALALHSLEAFIGKCADVQPGKLSDCMLHETAVAWLRLQLLRPVPREPWEESRSLYLARLKRITRSVNAAYGAAGLCSASSSK